jgi:hypothetical protein
MLHVVMDMRLVTGEDTGKEGMVCAVFLTDIECLESLTVSAEFSG